MDNDIIARECRFVFHLPEIPEIRQDTHVVKELLYYKDGRREPNLRIIPHFKRPFWITKPHLQNHNQKKESEDIENLNRYTATESELAKSIASRLGPRYIGKRTMWDVVDSPYLYGTNVEARTIIKKMYQDKYPDVISSFKIGVLDIEADTDTDEMVIISLSTRERIYTAILNKIIPNKRDVEQQLLYLYKKHIPDTTISKNIIPEFELFETEIEMLKAVIGKAHEWKPDLIAVWNIDYDMPFMIRVCEKYGVDPKDIFTDPTLPKNLRSFEYKQGQKKKVTESGVFKPINPEEQWHIVKCPAHFYWIDAMSAHRYIRVGGKVMAGGYSLNNILNAELGKDFQKLKFESEETMDMTGIDWHKYMLKNKPLEYIIYNNWDVISILHLDDKTKDLTSSLPMLAGVSSFDIFNSGPKRIIDAMHFFYLDNKRVLGVKPSKVDDDKLLGLDSWIILLPSSRIKENGLKIIEENDELITNARGFIFDADQVSGYPSNTQSANVSADTTIREIIDIEGSDKEDFKLQNINLIFGKVNAVEYCTSMFEFPTMFEMKEKIKNVLVR